MDRLLNKLDILISQIQKNTAALNKLSLSSSCETNLDDPVDFDIDEESEASKMYLDGTPFVE